ncbi:MAG: ferredoxin [Actinomycetota bacterium]|jgi:ferredoxin
MISVTVDRKKCCGYAMCVETAPEVYQLDDSGYARVVVDVVAPDLVDAARRGANVCPQLAIRVAED